MLELSKKKEWHYVQNKCQLKNLRLSSAFEWHARFHSPGRNNMGDFDFSSVHFIFLFVNKIMLEEGGNP